MNTPCFLQVNTSSTAHMATLAQRSLDALHEGNTTLVSTTAGGQPLDDYDPLWFILVHPNSFPNGTGAAPDGMPQMEWARILFTR
jgi:hypothetical protein